MKITVKTFPIIKGDSKSNLTGWRTKFLPEKQTLPVFQNNLCKKVLS